VSITVEIPDELAARLTEAAADRGTTVELLAVEWLEDKASVVRRPRFVGVGSSGTKAPTGRRHRELIREAFARPADVEPPRLPGGSSSALRRAGAHPVTR
jgi:hypothetical protein